MQSSFDQMANSKIDKINAAYGSCNQNRLVELSLSKDIVILWGIADNPASPDRAIENILSSIFISVHKRVLNRVGVSLNFANKSLLNITILSILW